MINLTQIEFNPSLTACRATSGECRMSDDSATRQQIIELAQNRARNSVIALHHQHDPAIHEGRVRADQVWGEQQQALAASLPEGDTFRETVEFIGELDAIHGPPPHLRSQKR